MQKKEIERRGFIAYNTYNQVDFVKVKSVSADCFDRYRAVSFSFNRGGSVNLKTLFTIGFTKKTAEQFFTALTDNHVTRVLDVRLYNTSQLSRFSIYPDIKFFLSLFNIEYEHSKLFAPDPFTLQKYRQNKITWDEYVERFTALMDERGAVDVIKNLQYDIDRCCLLCSEESAKFCHRRLVAELIVENLEDNVPPPLGAPVGDPLENSVDFTKIQIVHLGDPLWKKTSSF